MAVEKSVSLLLRWFERHQRDLPWRRTKDPYAIWVSEIMLQQTQVKTVIPYWERWMRALPTVGALANARPEKLHKLWEGLGYYTRVRNMQRAAKLICEQHNGRFPELYEEVLELPGIGRYTAGAICSIAYNQPTPILDGNVIRVLSRLFCIRGDPHKREVNEKFWALAGQFVQAAAKAAARGKQRMVGNASALNQSMMELGATICAPAGALCGICPLRKCCLAWERGCVHHFPQLAPRIRSTPRKFVAFIVEHKGRILVRQRPSGVVNAHLWEFPNMEVTNGVEHPPELAKETVGSQIEQVETFGIIKHTITRYRITLELFRGKLATTVHPVKGEWVSVKKADRLPFTSAHRKALRHFASFFQRQ